MDYSRISIVLGGERLAPIVFDSTPVEDKSGSEAVEGGRSQAVDGELAKSTYQRKMPKKKKRFCRTVTRTGKSDKGLIQSAAVPTATPLLKSPVMTIAQLERKVKDDAEIKSILVLQNQNLLKRLALMQAEMEKKDDVIKDLTKHKQDDRKAVNKVSLYSSLYAFSFYSNKLTISLLTCICFILAFAI